jgi:hypothetical protein
MVSVPCERGYTIGFVAREVYGDELLYKISNPSWKPKKIHTHLLDEDHSIKQTLKTKIDTENFALAHCKVLMRGHRSGSLAEVLGTEFQFDNKRLTVYLKKFEDLSVCRLVRKLNEKFRTRISVVEVDSLHEIEARALKYLSLSQLSVSAERISHGNSDKSSQSFLLMKYQQLNGMNCPPSASSSASSVASASEDDIAHDYQHYGPFHRHQSRAGSYQSEESFSSISSSASASRMSPPPGFGGGIGSYSPPSSFHQSELFQHTNNRGVGGVVPTHETDFNSANSKSLSSPLYQQYFSSPGNIPTDWMKSHNNNNPHQPPNQHQQPQSQYQQFEHQHNSKYQHQNFTLFEQQLQLHQQPPYILQR